MTSEVSPSQASCLVFLTHAQDTVGVLKVMLYTALATHSEEQQIADSLIFNIILGPGEWSSACITWKGFSLLEVGTPGQSCLTIRSRQTSVKPELQPIWICTHDTVSDSWWPVFLLLRVREEEAKPNAQDLPLSLTLRTRDPRSCFFLWFILIGYRLIFWFRLRRWIPTKWYP